MTPARFGSIRAVFFDAVGTLLHLAPTAVEVYHQVGQRLGSRLELGTVAERFKRTFAEQVELDQRRGLVTSEERELQRWRTIVGQVLDDVADPEECFQALYNYFAQPGSWTVDPDAEETLAWLGERGFQLGICSNFDQRLHGILAGLSPLSRLRDVIISSEVGFSKPAGAFFDRLRQRASLASHQILVVGDDFENDYRGARQAGMAALLLDPRGRYQGRAEDRIERLGEVAQSNALG